MCREMRRGVEVPWICPSGGARGHPDEGGSIPDGGGAETPRVAAAPPAGYGVETSGFIAFGQLRIASPATICRIYNG